MTPTNRLEAIEARLALPTPEEPFAKDRMIYQQDQDLAWAVARIRALEKLIEDAPCECSSAAPVECSPCAIRAALTEKSK